MTAATPPLSRRKLLETGAAAGIAGSFALGATSDAHASDAGACAQREVAYICNSYGDTITVIDVARERIWRTIPMNFGTPRTINRFPSGQVTITNAPMNARLSLDHTQLWVPNSYGNNLAVVDVATRDIVRTIPLPMRPCDMDFTPDGRQVVMTFIGAELFDQGAFGVLDVESGQMIHQTMIGTNPEELALTHDGKRAYAVSKSLWVYDLEARRVNAELHLPHRCYDLLLSPDGSKLYVSALWDADKLLIVENTANPREIRVSGAIDMPVPCCMAFMPDGQHMLVSSAVRNSIHMVDLQSNRVVGSADMPRAGTYPSYIGVTQNGERALVCHSGGQDVSFIDTSSLRVVGSLRTGEGPSSITMGVV